MVRVCVPDDVAAGSSRLLFTTSGRGSAYREIRDWLSTAVGGEEGNHYIILPCYVCFHFGYQNHVTTV